MEDFADKTEAPTLHRRAEARRLGNVARSADLSAAILCLGAVLLLQHFGPGLSSAFRLMLSEGLSTSSVTTPGRIGYLLGAALAPMLAGMVAIGTLAHLAQTGFIFRFSAKPIDPAKNLERMFSGRSAAQLTINVLKLALVGVVTWFAARGRIGEIVSLQNRPFADVATAGASLMIAVALRIAAALLVLGIIDYAYQRFRHERELRMTKREVKEEQRRQDGAPETKRRRRQARSSLTIVRLEREIAAADVIVTGRDIAVAVRFDRSTMLAPRVVTKGRGLTARSIRETAERKEVTIVERDALARAVFRAVQIGRDVPDHLFAPVAEVLAFAFELQRRDA
ncbi:MAG: flagellar biosynthesis protein FlhB [Phycisphaerales bacterium]|jgi:flagellar biosynthetic protein FlhB|nr:flagellar biosynthesis protein FlhB [Phycisphaerales bacterium]